jgi:hypothetical protein
MISLMPRLLHFRGKCPWHPLDKRLVSHSVGLGAAEERKISFIWNWAAHPRSPFA